MKFKKNPNGQNEILVGDGFYVSYNPTPGMGLRIFESDTGGEETALCKPNAKLDKKWRILNGDFRKDYEKLVPLGFKACLKFFNQKKKKHASSWSSSGT